MKQETLKQLHNVEQEILDEIDRVCEKNGLKYYLIGGTLLGAIRHKGFIPWDDDLDIVMPRADFDKFQEVCKTDLDEKYYVHSSYNDPKYYAPFIKVRKHNTIFLESCLENGNIDLDKQGIWVDIAPMDDANAEDSFWKRVRTKWIKKHLQHFISYRKYGKWPQPIVSKILFAILSPLSTTTLRKIQDKLMRWENGRDCEYYVNYASHYDSVKMTMPKSDYEPSCRLLFEGKYYSSPGNYKNVLLRSFGRNYMELPPVEKRETHSPARLSFDLNGPDAEL